LGRCERAERRSRSSFAVRLPQLLLNIAHSRLTTLVNSDYEYYKILKSKSLWPVNFMEEQDWSGRGQHAEFQPDERNRVDEILNVQELLGSTSSAIVYSVKCKRIFLARKTILCNRRMTKAKAIEEVAHLYRLSHAHVVRVVGTYTLGSELSILIYPVAEYNLETFLDRLISRAPAGPGWITMLRALPQFIGCLANAMAHIHERMTKHMDIKPKNLLVRHVCIPPGDPRHDSGGLFAYKVYIADFGIARSYATLEDMETEGPTMFTRKYAAPEVVDKDRRGRPADIFSLGCVFVEIYVTWLSAVQLRSAHVRHDGAGHVIKREAEDSPLAMLRDLLMANSSGDASYQANIDAVQNFLNSMSENTGLELRQLAQGMIFEDPAKRFTAVHLVNRVGTAPCCKAGSDRLEAARWKEIEVEEEYNIESGTRTVLSFRDA